MIETEHLLLRSYVPADWESVHSFASQGAFAEFQNWQPKTPDDTKKFVMIMAEEVKQKPRYQFDFAICDNEEEELLGGCSIRKDSPNSTVATLGWAIMPQFQKKGYATEAAKVLIQYGFLRMGVTLIQATCDVRNLASIRVMEKAGMKRIEVIKGDRLQNGHVRDSVRYEITKAKAPH